MTEAATQPYDGILGRARSRDAGGQLVDRPPRAPTISLERVLPEIAGLIPSADHELAQRALLVPLVRATGELADVVAGTPSTFAFVIIEGVVLKRTRLDGRDSLELLSGGDAFGPPLAADRQRDARAVSSYRAHGEVSLAILGERFGMAACRWPQLSEVLHDRLVRQTHRASLHLAVLHMPRTEDRLIALFSDLAERVGRVTTDGIVIQISLSHELIGQLVGSKRPTVSLNLERLSRSGVLIRLDQQRWRLNTPGLLGG